MNVKKNVKKIVALGAAALITATTFAGVLAADLSNYPAPFVENGAFNGAIVVGAMAKTQDVIGAIDIGASLQAEAKTPVSTTGTSTATVSVEGGILLESDNQPLNFEEDMSVTLDKYDLPTLLADGELVHDDGTVYDFDQEITIGAANVTFSKPNTDMTEPALHLQGMSTGLLNFSIDFDDFNITEFDDGESFEMFGKVFTIKNIDLTDEVVLYASDLTQTLVLREPVDVEIDGKTYTIEILEANSDGSIYVSVNGEARSVTEGVTRTIGGIDIYMQDVFVSDIAGESATAKIFVGSEEYNLGSTFNTDNELQLNGVAVDGVDAYVIGNAATGLVTRIDFVINPTYMDYEALDDDYDFLLMGDTLVEPVFGFQFAFAEIVPALTTGRDHLKMVSDDELTFTFTNINGETFTFDVYEEASGNVTWAEYFNNGNTSLVLDVKGELIIIEEGAASQPTSIVYEFTGATNTSTTQEATFKNIATGQISTVKDGGNLGKSSVVVNVTDRNNVTLDGDTKSVVFTEAGTKITFEAPSPAVVNATTNNATIIIEEDEQGMFAYESSKNDTYTVFIDVNTDDEIAMEAPATFTQSDDDKAGDVTYGMNIYGSYFVYDKEDDQALDIYVPFGEATFSVYLAPPNAVKTTSAAATGDAYVINPAGLGVGILDIDAPALGSKPMIVVGGPSVNTLAAELMGNPSWDEMTETFEAGKAMIKFYSAENAVLVAGWNAIETQAACNVLVNYKMHDLTGDEMEVIVTSLDDITVNAVN